jgi:hypothetical protein
MQIFMGFPAVGDCCVIMTRPRPAHCDRSPDHGNAEQHITDREQDRRQSIDDHHAEDDLVTSTLLPAARTASQ